MKHVTSGASAVLLALSATATPASELSYTFVDFRVVSNRVEASGRRSPAALQNVGVEASDGDGVSVAGAVALPGRFYLHGAFNSSIVEHEVRIRSPFADVQVDDEFDLITSDIGLGFQQELAPRFDLTLELAYESAEMDFGSLAGENFDTKTSGAAARAGFRWNPSDPFEVFAMAGSSSYGEVQLGDRTFDDATVFNAGLRWYVFPDLGVGFDYRSGDLSSLTLSMRFSFGSLPW